VGSGDHSPTGDTPASPGETSGGPAADPDRRGDVPGLHTIGSDTADAGDAAERLGELVRQGLTHRRATLEARLEGHLEGHVEAEPPEPRGLHPVRHLLRTARLHADIATLSHALDDQEAAGHHRDAEAAALDESLAITEAMLPTGTREAMLPAGDGEAMLLRVEALSAAAEHAARGGDWDRNTACLTLGEKVLNTRWIDAESGLPLPPGGPESARFDFRNAKQRTAELMLQHAASEQVNEATATWLVIEANKHM